MTLGYRLAYRLGVTPWERAGEEGGQALDALLDREEQERSRPLGRAVDLGCGTGAHTVELARRGWEATGVDQVGRALATARSRPGADRVRFLQGDVTALRSAGVPDGVEFFLDVGCFHGLKDQDRAAYGCELTALATPTATLLLLAFRPGAPRPLPRGATQADVTAALPGWEVLGVEPADTSGLPRPLRRTAPQWYRLRRSQP
jgi:SAM-dependent methyltransferase